ncbi:MAG: hypothetical protein EBZ77_01480 [Chitinophagia bacterium]|nr:hypothetical protein [Chitinophagia bacterium]
MNNIIKVGAVSYLNTKPLLHGILHSDVANKIALTLDYPSRLAKMLREGTLDVALLPVAAIPEITGAQIVSDYGIASDGNVVSVALFDCLLVRRLLYLFCQFLPKPFQRF